MDIFKTILEYFYRANIPNKWDQYQFKVIFIGYINLNLVLGQLKFLILCRLPWQWY